MYVCLYLLPYMVWFVQVCVCVCLCDYKKLVGANTVLTPTYIRLYTHTYICAYAYTYMPMYVCTYVYTCMDIPV